ncbi:MAG: DUF1972 domain-containing protein [Bacteroidota bacterium]
MRRNISVGIIGTVGVPANYGGFETLAQQLIIHSSSFIQWEVFCSAPKYPVKERLDSFHGAKLHYLPLKANGWQSIPYDFLSILKAIKSCDALLILGNSGTPILPLVKAFSQKPILVNIDGLEWKRDKWPRPIRAYLKQAEAISVKFADEIIADNEAINYYVEEEYDSQAAYIPYGGDHTGTISPNAEDFKTYPFLKEKYAVKVCRIEPENQADIVLESFSQQQRFPLVFIGNWERSTFGRKLKERYQNLSHIHLLDPIYDRRQLNLIRSQASLYIHGHKAGGTNPSLVEAMFLGLPVLTYDVSYNRFSTNHQGIYFKNIDSLGHSLESLQEEDLIYLGKQMKKIAQEKYTWDSVCGKYEELILQSLGEPIVDKINLSALQA